MLNFMPQAAKACLDANISEILKEKSFVRMAEEDLKTETGTTPKPTEGRRVSWTEFVSAGKGAE